MTSLSQIQRAILVLVVEGLSDREIGRRLFYSEHTIDHYVHRQAHGP